MADTVYLCFKEILPEKDRKTKLFFVMSLHGGDVLGRIRWYGAWRQYAFFPAEGTIWNPECLDSVNEKIRALMAERKEARAT